MNFFLKKSNFLMGYKSNEKDKYQCALSFHKWIDNKQLQRN